MIFHYSNYNIILFLSYVKNKLDILYIFINTYNFYYIYKHWLFNLQIYFLIDIKKY
jgi:hypothetical protein